MNDNDEISLKEYFNNKLDQQKELLNTKIESIEKATVIAEHLISIRLENSNQFKEELKEKTKSFINRSEHDLLITKFDNKSDELKIEINKLNESKSFLAGKASQSAVNIAYIIGVIDLLLSLFAILLYFSKLK